MNKLFDNYEYIKNPQVEALAILLYQADEDTSDSWFKINKDDRRIYREIANGERPLNG